MGTIKVQKILQRVSDDIRNGKEVAVRIVPEPDNPIDKNAIASNGIERTRDVLCRYSKVITCSNEK